MLPERGLEENTPSESQIAHFAHTHGTTLWLLAIGAMACFLGALVIAARSTRR